MFFTRFTELAREKGKSTTAVAVELNIPKSTVVYWRHNENAVPKAAVLQKIADYFNVTTDYLIGKTDIRSGSEGTADEVAKVALFGGDQEVTEEMWQEVKDYVEYLKHKHAKDDNE